MLTSEGCAARRKRLWESLTEACDTLIFTQPESLIYLANYVPSSFSFHAVESTAALILWPDRAILLGDNLLSPFLDRSHVNDVVTLDWYTGKRSAGHRRVNLLEALFERLPQGSGSRIGVESPWPDAGLGSRS